MNCKICNAPIYTSIEGALICESCWGGQQMTAQEKTLNQEILLFEMQEKINKKFGKQLAKFGIIPDYVDGFACQVGDLFFDAEIYLGDLTGRASNEIAKDLAECIKATFDELN